MKTTRRSTQTRTPRVLTDLHPNCRLWIYAGKTEGVFGDGKWRLLDAVDAHGSLQAAARELGMSYRKAWADLRKAESCLGLSLLRRQRGGRTGGATTCTPAARAILEAYAAFRRETTEGLEAAFARFVARIAALAPNGRKG